MLEQARASSKGINESVISKEDTQGSRSNRPSPDLETVLQIHTEAWEGLLGVFMGGRLDTDDRWGGRYLNKGMIDGWISGRAGGQTGSWMNERGDDRWMNGGWMDRRVNGQVYGKADRWVNR